MHKFTPLRANEGIRTPRNSFCRATSKPLDHIGIYIISVPGIYNRPYDYYYPSQPPCKLSSFLQESKRA